MLLTKEMENGRRGVHHPFLFSPNLMALSLILVMASSLVTAISIFLSYPSFSIIHHYNNYGEGILELIIAVLVALSVLYILINIGRVYYGTQRKN